MRIDELANPDAIKLAAIGQFLLGRATDTSAQKTISADAFIRLAKDNGINLTLDQLRTLSQQTPLSNIIGNIEGTDQMAKIIFKGADDQSPDTMSVDQARATVNQMAKRAIDLK